MPLPKEKERFTYQDYLTWPEEERWELIDGIAYNMSAAPYLKHQMIAGNLYIIIRNALLDKKCIPFIAPVDVVLSNHDIVQPDIIIVCDKNKITEKNIQGAPDVIVEILSPSTSTKDRREKRKLYEKYGVKEYVLIDSDGLHVERYLLRENGHYDLSDIFDAQQTLTLLSLEGLEIPLWEVFGIEKK